MGNYSEVEGRITFQWIDDIETINKIKVFVGTNFGEFATVGFDEIEIEFIERKAYRLGEEITEIVDFLKNIGIEDIEVDITRYGEPRDDIEHFKIVDGQVVSAKAEVKYTFRDYTNIP